MGQVFELAVESDPGSGVLRFRLTDGVSRQIAAHQVQLAEQPQSLWEGLFATQEYVERYTGVIKDGRPETGEDLLNDLGAFLGCDVLGREVTGVLARGIEQRTLLVRMPEPTNDLAAALARVAWEQARTHPSDQSLLERNVSVRVLPLGANEQEAVATVEPGGPLRVLLIFAEAPGSRPLAMRQEREELLRLFHEELMPRHQAEVEVLCHGVTRQRVREAVERAGGYHLVHWSGHGHHDFLELYREDGRPDLLSGHELVNLFGQAGGFIPSFVFLSACLSGTLRPMGNRVELQSVLAGGAQAARQGTVRSSPPTRSRVEERAPPRLDSRPGYTGSAFALLAAGVPLVLAMRYEVGDAYARALAGRFYRHLLVDPACHPADISLALARRNLLRPGPASVGFTAVDHVTPLLLGRPLQIRPRAGRSPALKHLRPQPQPLLPGGSRELDCPAVFVGRGSELTRLGIDWLGRDGPAVAVVAGLAGLGKTSLAAEAVYLWHRRFDWVFAFQAKPTAVSVEGFYSRLDGKLTLESHVYRGRCETRPAARVHLPEQGLLIGEARYEQMRQNLLEALRDEAILLVFDNFETCLEEVRSADGYQAADLEWDRLLVFLAERLPDTRSRLLLTSRHRLAALAGAGRAIVLSLGPLPLGEALHLLQQHPVLVRLTEDDEGQRLALRLLEVSRGHPLLLSHLAAIGTDRLELAHALDTLAAQGLSALPELFAAAVPPDECERERAYLEDVTERSIDLLLARSSPAARHLLWLVTLAAEPVGEGMIAGVASGMSAQHLPQDTQDRLVLPPADLREGVSRSRPARVDPLLAELVEGGLLTGEEVQGERVFGFHELVHERTLHWMTAHSEERRGRTEAQVWAAYGELYAAEFQRHQTSGWPGARDQAAEAGERALAYLLRARSFERLHTFAGALITGTSDSTRLRSFIALLTGVAEELPSGETRWMIRTYLADALTQSGRGDQALGLYEKAAAEAEAAGNWDDLGKICQNWARALCTIGALGEAERIYQQSAAAKRKAGSPVVNTELEVLRIQVYQGHAERALPEIERRLAQLRGWYRRQQSGSAAPQLDDAIVVSRAFIAALDIAVDGNLALKRWAACLELLVEMEATERELGEGELPLARTRFNQYAPLIRLGRLKEAQHVLEGCLDIFRHADDASLQAKALSGLADLWSRRNDSKRAVGLERRALALRNCFPDSLDRADSHGNLAAYLFDSRELEESACHNLTALLYFSVSGRLEGVHTWEGNLKAFIQNAAQAGRSYELPRLTDLLARPEFEPLRRFLAERGADPNQLQLSVDQRVARLRASFA
jgi:tetratricopeptide (TPR) repeat protein